MRDLDWNDLQAFLAVVRAGRLTAAAQAMRVDHSTLSRRITGLEAALKTRLFERRPAGYVPTAAGERLVAEAEAVESILIGMRAKLTDQVLGLAGSVRIGTPEGFGTYFLTPQMIHFCARHRELQVELVANPRTVSLSKREADIGIMMARPEEGRLHATRLTDYEMGLYASRHYLARHAPIASRADIRQHAFIGYIDDLLPTAAHGYVAELDKALNPQMRMSNIITQLVAAASGGGLCMLPCFMAGTSADLVRLLPEEIAITRSYWLVIHSDVRELARVRAVIDFIAETVAEHRRLFLPSGAA